jgi:hypothetical protein
MTTTKTKPQAWTRATTVASTLEDRFGLERWSKRNVVLGIAARPDLYALAASATPDDKDLLHSIIDDAEEAAKSRSGANLGTALHRITERIDTGEILDVPTTWRGDVDAYCQTLADNSIKIHPEYIERVVLAKKAKIAGTLDRLVTYEGTTYVADLKTGVSALDYGATDIAVQLAIYAHASHMWKGAAKDADNNRDRYGRYLLPDPDEVPDEYEPMPEVDKTRAIVIHLPVEAGRCDLYWVDIAAGVEAVKQALWVREWRKQKLSTPLNPAPFELDVERPDAEVIPIGGATKQDDDW